MESNWVKEDEGGCGFRGSLIVVPEMPTGRLPAEESVRSYVLASVGVVTISLLSGISSVMR